MDEFITQKKIKNNFELVLDCVVPYIQENEDLNSVSLVSKKFLENDSLTRKHVTVYVHFLPDPKRLSLRFPNLESLSLKSYSHGYYTADECSIPVAPWIHEIGDKFERLNSLSIRNMVVSSNDLRRLAKTRGGSLRSLEIWRCRMDSEDGLVDIARYCKNLRKLRLDNHYVDSEESGKWLHELALCNTVMESLYFRDPFDDPENWYNLEDVTRLAKKCSGSLVSLDILPNVLSDFKEVFKHAKKLEHFGIGIVDQDRDREYRGFEFPRNIRGLRIDWFDNVSYRFLFPYLNQLRELELQCQDDDLDQNCQCLFFMTCPNLEVLNTDDMCGDRGFQFIGQFCKKLRKLTHSGPVTHVGLKAVAQGCPHLDYLKVEPSKISNEALKCVGNHLKKLRDFRILLDIEDGIIVDGARKLDKGIRAMLEGCRKLERLHIQLCNGGLTDVGLGYLGEYGHNLRHVSLSYTGESDAGLLKLSNGCPKLRKLQLMGCPFSEQAIATLFNLNHSLRHVWIGRNPADVLVLTRPVVSTQMGESRKEKASEAERSRLDDFSEDNLQEVACLSRSDDHTPEDKEDYEGGVESKVCRNVKKCKADIFVVERSGKLHEDEPGSGRSQCADKATSVTDESLQDVAGKENPTKEE